MSPQKRNRQAFILARANLAMTLMTLLFFISVRPAHASTTTFVAGSLEMAPGHAKRVGDVQFVYQESGNLIAFKDAGPVAWSATSILYYCVLPFTCRARFTPDGNLVLNNGISDYWQSNTGGNAGARLTLSSEEPYLRIHALDGRELWKSSQAGKTAPPQIKVHSPTVILAAPNSPLDFGNRSLILRPTGELRISFRGQPNNPLWSATVSDPCSGPNCLASWQVAFDDGELSVSHYGIAKWSTGTRGNPNAQLILNAFEPYMQILSSQGHILWSSSARVQPPAELKFPAGCVSSPRVFDVKYFRKMNPQLQLGSNDQAYANYWCERGLKQGMRASQYYASYDYLRMYPELRNRFKLVNGNPDFESAAKHFLSVGSRGLGAGLVGTFENPNVFDLDFYRARNYPRAGATDHEVIVDYLHRGIPLGLQSHPYFSVNYYIENNPRVRDLLRDVKEGRNELAIENYLSFGMGLGRLAVPPGPSAVAEPVQSSEEAVFTHPTDSCAVAARGPAAVFYPGDVSDAAPRMFIDMNHQYQLITGANEYFLMKSDSLNDLKRDCLTPTLQSKPERDFSKGRSLDWLEATYTKDGRDIFGVSANDWHGTYWYYPECLRDENGPLPVTDSKCWWGTLVSLVSHDGGRSYATATSNPREYILAQPPGNANLRPFNGKHFGYFGVSNIMKNPLDGAYYFFADVSGIGPVQVQPQGVRVPDNSIGACLFRAASDADLEDPTSWRGFDPDTGLFDTLTGPGHNELCKPLRSFRAGTVRHISWNTFFQEFLILYHRADGVYYSLSVNHDLSQWSAPRLLYRTQAFKTEAGVSSGSYYPTLIDHSYELLARPFADRAERRNFDITGSSPHLYLVRWNKGGRSLNRLQVRFRNVEAQ